MDFEIKAGRYEMDIDDNHEVSLLKNA